MSVQPVVPATLLEDIKKGLVALGYAHESTPLAFVQDAYFKYVMVHQVAMAKGFSPQIPYAIALLPQAIQDQLASGYEILAVLDQWGNNGGLLSNRYPGNVIDDVIEQQLTDFDYTSTRTGYTANKESKFAWNIGTVSTAGLNNDPVVGEAHAINRDGRLDIKMQDFDLFEIVLSKSNGFPIHQWAEDVSINDRPPAVPTESISIKFSSAEPGIIKSTVNGAVQPDIDMGTADESTRFQFRILRNPENIDEVTLSAYVYNGAGGQQDIANLVAMVLPPHETKTLNLSCQAIAKVGSESSMVYLTSSIFDGNDA